jgi:hypothetical protein
MPVLYVGAIDSTVQLQALSDAGVDNIVMTPTDILAVFVPSVAYTLNQMLQPTSPNGYRYEVTTAGTASTEPTWPVTIGSTVVSGGVTFKCKSTKHDITEVTLALASADLATNTPGASLSLGNTILGGTGNAVKIYMRVINAVNITSNNTSAPEIGVTLNNLIESEI